MTTDHLTTAHVTATGRDAADGVPGAAPNAAAPSVLVNGSPVPLTPGLTVGRAVSDLTGRALRADGTAADGQPLGIAVALDDAVVPRSRWSRTELAPDQELEIVTAVQGG